MLMVILLYKVVVLKVGYITKTRTVDAGFLPFIAQI